jgi:hypothetical protein
LGVLPRADPHLSRKDDTAPVDMVIQPWGKIAGLRDSRDFAIQLRIRIQFLANAVTFRDMDGHVFPEATAVVA